MKRTLKLLKVLPLILALSTLLGFGMQRAVNALRAVVEVNSTPSFEVSTVARPAYSPVFIEAVCDLLVVNQMADLYRSWGYKLHGIYEEVADFGQYGEPLGEACGFVVSPPETRRI